MKRDYPNLCKPLRVGALMLRNRICSAPMGATDITAEGSPGLRTLGFYEARAKGGAAVVTVSELVVHPETDGSQMLHLSLCVPGQLGSFAYVADAIKRHGAIASIELSHSGQYAGTYMVDKNKKGSLCQWGPSDGIRPDGIPVKALETSQIDDIVSAYANAAALAKRAGFQMVMVHAGHGWLINQFLSPYFNKRDDEYGGSLKGRTLLAKRILKAVREEVGAGFPIELRMSGSELFDGGYDIDEGVRIAQELEEYVDIIHVSAGSYQFGFSITHPSMFREHGVNVHLAEEIKKHVSVPVACIGGLSDPDQMEEIIASGKADLVAMARGLLADPEIPNKVMANKGDDIIHCLRCFVCMAERPVTQTRRCAVNPRIGREFEGLEIVRCAQKKKVLVVGGGIAGMVAAYTAAARGHDVTLCEKESELGGILRTERAIPFKYDMYRLALTYTHLLKEMDVNVICGCEVDAALIDKFKPDAVVIAVGSRPIKLPIPVSEDAYVLSIDDLYLNNAQVTGDVAVVGGGLTGCECALYLTSKGYNVSIIEMRGELAPDANIRHRPILLEQIAQADINIHTDSKATSITAEGIYVEKDGIEMMIPASCIISAIGQRSRSDVVDKLLDAAPFVRVIGDALRPSNITNAVYEGFHAALDI
ncbi:MAG: FAD-dependent oxidoreductase [Eggerthellaceae bacterium]|nr:FAD-dependent oxidoreductase [Eggerthellaceae bacterium]